MFVYSGFDLLIRACAVIAAVTGIFSFTSAQSTSQVAPTGVTTNEIRGVIAARDIGDPRLTNHFYDFNGNQGDVFINVVTENLDGDIDIFIVDGLKPITKITVFSDASNSETGRVIYLRKSEKLLLRVQGRSPNDLAATYRIKFAGSFVPLDKIAVNSTQDSPEVSGRDQGRIQVNSVGTIIEQAPKVADKPLETKAIIVESAGKIVEQADQPAVAAMDDAAAAEQEIQSEKENLADAAKIKPVGETVESSATRAKPLVIISDDPLPENVPGVEPEAQTEKNPDTTEEDTGLKQIPVDNAEPAPTAPQPAAIGPVDPKKLVKVRVILTMKDGRIINHQINSIFSFNMTQGILRIVLNDGTISRYSLLDVERVAIEEIQD